MPDLFEETIGSGFIDDNTVRINLLDERSNYGVMYGLNWGFDNATGALREENGKVTRSGNEAYFQLPPEVYRSDFFPTDEEFHITDDLGYDFVFARKQKPEKTALEIAESNRILGLYLRHRLGLKSGALITKTDLLNYGRTDIVFKKDGDSFYMDFSTDKNIGRNIRPFNNQPLPQTKDSTFNPLLTALRTKPFVLLAGISGTGKSRIVRELAKACWKQGDAEFGNNHPKNFCMVQVKPNWHDSSELIGYVSRINGEKYVVGPFLRFMAKAINDSKTPYFLCLDEMNLAPVEQYFAEYLSVIESRKLNADGSITTDPIIDFEHTDAYKSLIDQLFPNDDKARDEYLKEIGGKRLTIPQNLFVVGTVNMDETTFSFSRKVLDRAMTIEMNEVDLHGGLDANAANELGHIENLIPTSVEGKDVYAQNQDLCDKVLEYLAQVNDALDKTPFKIAYRTRNEFLVYAVNRGAENLTATLDEMTAMKILSRIEGDSDRTKKPLEALQNIVNNQIVAAIPEPEEGKQKAKSISAEKITEMLKKLDSGYTSFWS